VKALEAYCMRNAPGTQAIPSHLNPLSHIHEHCTSTTPAMQYLELAFFEHLISRAEIAHHTIPSPSRLHFID
jgi:hypothetical protein